MKLALAPTPENAGPASADAAASGTQSASAIWGLCALILAVGLFLRIWPSAGYRDTGFDEVLYQINVMKLEKTGLLDYRLLAELYIEDQRKPDSMAKLPPTRFFYVAAATLWKQIEFGDTPPVPPKDKDFVTKDPALVSLHRVASLFSCLGLIVSGLAAWRIFGLKYLPPILALLACSPLAIQLSQHAMIDGVFTFWATLSLWLLWENLQKPNDTRRLAAYGLSLALMVMTKENSFFVYLALGGLVVSNHWTHLGTITPRLLVTMVLGPAAGFLALVFLAGGFFQFFEIYRLLVTKAQTLNYAIKTGDGPWYRYLVDLLLLSPLVLLLAVGGVFTQLRRHRGLLFLVAFVGFSYLIMCNVRYGMNLRYASIWDFPLRALAALQVTALAARFGKYQLWAAAAAIVFLCAYDLNQYKIYFIDGKLYELVTGGLLWSVKILK